MWTLNQWNQLQTRLVAAFCLLYSLLLYICIRQVSFQRLYAKFFFQKIKHYIRNASHIRQF